MTREELLAALRRLATSNDPERAHVEADALLLRYINDDEITADFDDVPGWYS